MERPLEKHGLRFAVSEHLGPSYNWFAVFQAAGAAFIPPPIPVVLIVYPAGANPW